MKTLIKRAIRRTGYSVRDMGIGVAGIDLLHDASVLLSDGPLLWDVGANIGQTAEAMRATFPGATIVSFEPSPTTVVALRANVAALNVSVEALAFSDAVGTLPFHVTRDHSVNDSLLAPVWDAGGTTVPVPVETVDNYCTTRHIPRLGLLKIDTQGNDLRVLHGARGMLRAKRIDLYSCEACCRPRYAGQATLIELLAYAAEIGYTLVGCYEQTYVDNRLSYLDLMFRA